MRGMVMIACSMVLAAGPAYAVDDPVQKALKALERHRYEDASRDLRAALPSLEQSKQASAQLALGMISLKHAELHRELARVSASLNAEYLRRLSADRGEGRSRYSDLYLGIALLDAGKPEAAAQPLEKFLAGTGDPKFQALARIALGTGARLSRDTGKAAEIWNGISMDDPDVRTELAAAWSRAGTPGKEPAALCDAALGEVKRAGRPASIIMVKNCLGVFARAGLVDRGADLLAKADLKAPSYRESIGKSKVLSFYEAQLLSSISDFSLQESIRYLEKASADQQLKSFANFSLGEAHALAGNLDQAARATAAFLSSPQMPPVYKNKALVRQAMIQYQKGRQTDAIGTLDELSRVQGGEPEILAEILNACGTLRIECPRVAQAGAAAAEAGQGRRFLVLNAGLGRYYLGRKDLAKAAAYLDAGRDKGNKNKIESNDPLLLIDLAEISYRTRKFSEALEILFEMSKQFPQVRQAQEALQGIYSMEHRSAGDVKIN